MKKKLLLLLLISTYSFAQKEGDGRTEWGNWFGIDCFKGLQFSLKCTGYSVSTKSYWYNIQAKNNYNSIVHFSVDYFINGEKITVGLWTLKPGESRSHTSLPANTYLKNGGARVSVNNVCFKNDNSWGSCLDGCYAQCDSRPGVPNQPNCNGNKTSNLTSKNQQINNSKSYNSNEQANNEIDNLNIYLLKIPDGDSQKQQILSRFENIKNASLTDNQRAAQIRNLTSQAISRANELENESNQKTGQYMDYYIKATDAGMAGNCDEAISNWKSAIALAVNDAQRNNAQQWLEEVNKAKNNGQCKSTNSISKTTNSNTSTTYVPNPQNAIPNQDAIRAQNNANTAASIAQLGVAVGGIVNATRDLKKAERELHNQIINIDQNKTEAINYFNNYLKYKKRSRKILWTGVGITSVGLGLVLAGTSSLNFGLLDVGAGMAIGGGVLFLASVPSSIRSSDNFGKAQNLVSFNSNMEIKPFLAKNKTGSHVGISIGF